jgi:hypothetical protein
MPVHYRLEDYNIKYRQPLHELPDDPILHYDTETEKWVTAVKPYKMPEGLHVVHVVPDSDDFNDSELVAIITRKLADGSTKTYGASCYYVPENMELLRAMFQDAYEIQGEKEQDPSDPY